MSDEKIATVHWEGAGKNGKGQITTGSGALEKYPYGFASRFEDDREGSNPEELLGAAHAACFTMAFSIGCEKAGYATSNVETEARVRLVREGDGFLIDRIGLKLVAHVPGISADKFDELAQAAKSGCPLSKALASVPQIELETVLIGD
jgi:osmotically inducible protein OsmC